jgi:NAD(P) transhydrogenase subunit alpha
MTSRMAIGVVRESDPRERRVALDPDAVDTLVHAGLTVLVESGAGVAAGFPDPRYLAAGAQLTDRSAVVDHADVLAVVRTPDAGVLSRLRSGQVLLGLLDPVNDPELVTTLVRSGVTAVAFELLPRTVSRAQSMDALSSQASAAGYRAIVAATAAFGRYLPMMITAAGTARPASVIVLGAGVAGLQAIGTARRLGAVVTGYDVRPASRTEVESLGAQFLTPSLQRGDGAGGYARELTADEQASQQDELARALTQFDIIVTTAKVPGKAPPVLVSAQTIASLRSGSVCVDLAAGPRGGNVAGSVDGQTTVTDNGVTIIGAGELASDLATSASQMYARNVVALLRSFIADGQFRIDPDDEVHTAMVVTLAGEVRSAAVRAAMGLPPASASPLEETRS